MKITLRKANALQQAITEAIAGLELATDVTINEFEVPATKLEDAKNKFFSNLSNRNDLLSVLYEIRRDVARANATAGINDLLAEVAMVEKDIALYTRLCKTRPALEQEVVVGKLNKLKSRSEDQFYGREDHLQTSIFSENEVSGFKTGLLHFKKQKIELQDSLLELNIKTEIEISATNMSILSASGVV